MILFYLIVTTLKHTFLYVNTAIILISPRALSLWCPNARSSDFTCYLEQQKRFDSCFTIFKQTTKQWPKNKPINI